MSTMQYFCVLNPNSHHRMIMVRKSNVGTWNFSDHCCHHRHISHTHCCRRSAPHPTPLMTPLYGLCSFPRRIMQLTQSPTHSVSLHSLQSPNLLLTTWCYNPQAEPLDITYTYSMWLISLALTLNS